MKQTDINIVLTGGFIDPQIQGVNSERDFIQFIADKSEIMDFIIRNPAVPGNLNQPAGQWIDFIQTGYGFKNDIRQLGDFHFGNVSVSNGTFM